MKPKITKDTLISEIVNKYPELGDVLVEDYGFHCIGCFASEMETIEQGAEVHGYGKEDIKKILQTLNGILDDQKQVS